MSPKIIHVSSPKGGSTKTALATTLAGGLSAMGSRVLVVDIDPNGADGGATKWAALAQAAGRSPAFYVTPALPRRVTDLDFIIYDHPPGRPTRLPDGLILMPTTLDPGTYFSTLRAMAQLRKRRPAPILVASRVRLDRAESRQLLARMPGVPVIRDRAIYPSAFGCGATIYDTDAGLRHAGEARAEFQPVIDAVLRALRVSFKQPEVA